MANIQEDILEEFYKRLAEAEGFTPEKVIQLRALLSGRKPKAIEVIKALSENTKEKLP